MAQRRALRRFSVALRTALASSCDSGVISTSVTVGASMSVATFRPMSWRRSMIFSAREMIRCTLSTCDEA